MAVFAEETSHALRDTELQETLGCIVLRAGVEEATAVYLKTMMTEYQWQALSTTLNGLLPGKQKHIAGILPSVPTMLKWCEPHEPQ